RRAARDPAVAHHPGGVWDVRDHQGSGHDRGRRPRQPGWRPDRGGGPHAGPLAAALLAALPGERLWPAAVRARLADARRHRWAIPCRGGAYPPPADPAVTEILQTTGLSKRYGGLLAVDGLDLAVREGEIHALIGPNGAGKTTVLNLVTRITEPSAGR